MIGLSRISTVAGNTVQELVRERIFIGVGLVAVFISLVSMMLGELSFDEQERLIVDVSLFTIEISALFLALYLGSSTLRQEMERQTCLLALARPLSRSEFLLGKWVGVGTLVLCLVVLLGAQVAVQTSLYVSALGLALLSIFLKTFTVATWAFVFSQGLRPLLAFFLGLCFYLISHAHGDMAFFAEQSKSETYIAIVQSLRWIFPSFDLYNWKNHFSILHPPAAVDVGRMLLQVLAWSLIGISLASRIFRKRDIV